MMIFRSKLFLVSMTLAMVIAGMAAPRITGSSWRAIIEPMDMRELEGQRVQWEGNLVLRSMHAMLTDFIPNEVFMFFSTDEYRALVPIFTAAIFTRLTGSYYWGTTVSELLWWWFGAIATVVLGRRLAVGWPASVIAGMLVASSPLAVAHVGATHLHTASSVALPVATVIAWDGLQSTHRSSLVRVFTAGFAIFLSSIVYTYQWVLVPWLLGLTLVVGQSRRWLGHVLGAGALFIVMTLMAQGLLHLGGLSVHAHQNDPLRVLADRNISHALVDSLEYIRIVDVFQGIYIICTTMWRIAGDMVLAYHPVIVGFAILGTFHGTRVHTYWMIISTALALIQGYIYGLSWVLMSGFPIVYLSAGAGIALLSSFLARLSRTFIVIRSCTANNPLRSEVFYMIIFTLVCMSATNLDLFGNDDFAIRWWGSWYKPH